MRIAICDDDAHSLQQLQNLTQAYRGPDGSSSISVSAFEWAEDLLEAARKIGGFDVYVLDIVMHRMNGIQLGMHLRHMGYDGKIIFLTSSEEYAIDAFKVRAFDYLLKPVRQESYFTALDQAVNALSQRRDKGLIVKTKDSSVRISFDNILYAELCKRKIVYHLVGGNVIESNSIRSSFSEAVQDLLRDKRFILCGAGITANLHHITMVEKDALIFGKIRKVYLSKKICSEIRTIWCDFYFNGEDER